MHEFSSEIERNKENKNTIKFKSDCCLASNIKFKATNQTFIPKCKYTFVKLVGNENENRFQSANSNNIAIELSLSLSLWGQGQLYCERTIDHKFKMLINVSVGFSVSLVVLKIVLG